MPTYVDVVTAIPKIGNGDKALARANFVKRYAYALADSEDLRTITVTDPDYGAIPLYVMQQRRLFQYDATDATTAHDGTTCLVSADGKRYKIDDFLLPWSVKSKTLTAPPGSPAIGDAYIVAPAATGAWAGKDNQVATFSSRSWLFLVMPEGRHVFNEADGAFYYRDNTGSWIRGAGALAFTAKSVPLSAIIGTAASLTIRVENQTRTAPPATWSTGDSYVIAAGATGDWAGQDLKVAIAESNGILANGDHFTIYAPQSGDTVYDKAIAKRIRYSGAAWIADGDAMVLLKTIVAAGDTTIDFVNGVGGVVLDDTFDAYELRLSSIKSSVDDVEVRMRVGTGAGPTWQSTGYQYVFNGPRYDLFIGTGSGTAAAQMVIGTANSAGNALGNAAAEHFNAVIDFDNPELTDYCTFYFRGAYNEAVDGGVMSFAGASQYLTSGQITGIRFLLESGVFNSGRFSLYGLRKS